MVFLPPGNHSFKVFVLDINFLNLINFGLPEESRLISRNNLQRPINDEEQALASHDQKGKEKNFERRNTRRISSSTLEQRTRKRKDVSKFQ